MGKESDALEDSLSLLKSLAFSGNLNAVALGDDLSKIPQTEGVPGSGEAKRWFKEQYESGEGTPSILILVGGPGNGKSLLISQLVSNPEYEALESDTSEKATRAAKYRFEGRILHAVNDATIGMNALRDAQSLIEDIDNSISENEWLVIAVNRGVLVEELAGGNARVGTPAVEIIKWLNAKQGQRSNQFEEYSFLKEHVLQEASEKVDYIDSIQIKDSGINVIAVHMDTCSLCEELPKIELDGAGNLPIKNAEPYKVNQFLKRDPEQTAKTPGGKLLTEVFSVDRPEGMFSSIPEIYAEDWNPIYANVAALANEKMRTGLLSILRASEIVEGSRYTWRTFWGSIAYATVGYLFEPTQPPPLKWITEHKPSITDNPEEISDDDKAIKQLQEMIKLSEIRTHQAIFGVASFSLRGNLNGSQFSERSNFTESPVWKISKVDPILDAIKGYEGDIDLDGDPSEIGWSSVIGDAFEGIENGESPIEKLKLETNDPFFITKFDEMLDACVCRVMTVRKNQVFTDKEKSNLLIWYGRYLTRLYAVAKGFPAFVNPIEKWTLIWSDAFTLGGDVRADDSQKLSRLLFPQYEGQNGLLFLPYFESRVIPLVHQRGDDLLALKIDTRFLVWKWRLSGDSILVRPTSNDFQEGLEMSLDVDFSFVREMEACGSHSRGVTELSLAAEPVVERFRSSLLSRTSENSNVFVLPADGSEEIPLRPLIKKNKGGVSG